MFTQPKSSVLPSPEALAEIRQRQLLEQFKISEALFDAFTVPVHIREDLNKRWAEALSNSPVGKKIYRLVLPIHECRLGGVWLEVAARDQTVELWLCVGDPHDQGETDEDGEPLWVRINSTSMKLDDETRAWLEKVWKPFNPVKPLQAVNKIMPNAPCPCSSGKKFKRCTCVEYH